MEEFNAMPGHSRLWIYQSDRELTKQEKERLNSAAVEFASSWQSHGVAVRSAVVLPNDFTLIFAVDQTVESPGGCSIDSSVRFMREYGAQLNIDFFNRLMLLVERDTGLDLVHVSDFTVGIERGKFSASTKIYDNTVATKAEWEKGWVKKAQELPWLATWLDVPVK